MVALAACGGGGGTKTVTVTETVIEGVVVQPGTKAAAAADGAVDGAIKLTEAQKAEAAALAAAELKENDATRERVGHAKPTPPKPGPPKQKRT